MGDVVTHLMRNSLAASMLLVKTHPLSLTCQVFRKRSKSISDINGVDENGFAVLNPIDDLDEFEMIHIGNGLMIEADKYQPGGIGIFPRGDAALGDGDQQNSRFIIYTDAQIEARTINANDDESQIKKGDIVLHFVDRSLRPKGSGDARLGYVVSDVSSQSGISPYLPIFTCQRSEYYDFIE